VGEVQAGFLDVFVEDIRDKDRDDVNEVSAELLGLTIEIS